MADATTRVREGFIDELGQISTCLRSIAGAEAERAEWLNRRLRRVIRKIGEPSADPNLDQ